VFSSASSIGFAIGTEGQDQHPGHYQLVPNLRSRARVPRSRRHDLDQGASESRCGGVGEVPRPGGLRGGGSASDPARVILPRLRRVLPWPRYDGRLPADREPYCDLQRQGVS